MSGKSEKDDPQSQRKPYRLKNRAPKKGHAIMGLLVSNSTGNPTSG